MLTNNSESEVWEEEQKYTYLIGHRGDFDVRVHEPDFEKHYSDESSSRLSCKLLLNFSPF